MGGIGVTFLDLAFERLQCRNPFLRSWPSLIHAVPRKCLLEQSGDRGRHNGKRRSAGGRFHLKASSFAAVDKPELRDGFFQRHFASPKKAAGKRMFTHKEQLKDQKGKPEIVVVGGTDDALEILLILQFRGSESWNANSAWKPAIANKDLERIAINYSYNRIL